MSIQTKTYKSKKTNKDTTKYYAVIHDTLENKPLWSKGFSKKSEAKKAETQMLHDLSQRIKNPPVSTVSIAESITIGEIAKQWFVSFKDYYANTTYHTYTGYYNSYIAPVFGDIKVSMIRPINIQVYKDEMSKKYSASVVNKSLNLLSVMIDYAIDSLEVAENNPCKKIKRAKIRNNNYETWSDTTIAYFISLPKVKNSNYYDMLLLSFSTGLRPSEVCGIFKSDISDNGILSLSKGLDKYGVISDMKTTGSHRPIQLHSFLLELLRKRVQAKNSSDFLFVSPKGNPINPDTYSKGFGRLIRSHNNELKKHEAEYGKLPKGHQYLSEIRLYDARHSFATNLLLDENVPIKVISEIMGNSVKTMLTNYAHVTQRIQSETVIHYSEKILASMNNKLAYT